MTDLHRRDATFIATGLSNVLEQVFERLERLRVAVLEAKPEGAGWVEPQLSEAQKLVLQFLGEDRMHVGMGFVAEPGAVDSQDRYMLWWQQNDGRASRLRLNFDRTSIDVYDYVEMEWFQLPRGGGARVAFGPYVDYSGSELYIVTVTVPVVVDGTFYGVVGADLLFGELERRLLALLRGAPSDVVLVNAERRVVLANSPRWVAGSRLPALPSAGAQLAGIHYTDVAPLPDGTGWLVAFAEPERGRNLQ